MLVFGTGAAVGRYSLPAWVEVRREVVEHQLILQEVDVNALAADVKRMVVEQSEHRNVTRTTKTIKAPDGTVTTQETMSDKSELAVKTETTSATLTEVHKSLRLLEQKLVLERETKVVTTLPRYRLALAVGSSSEANIGSSTRCRPSIAWSARCTRAAGDARMAAWACAWRWRPSVSSAASADAPGGSTRRTAAGSSTGT